MGKRSTIRSEDEWKRAESNRVKRRQAFIAAYKANPANFVPGVVLTNLYRECKSLTALRARCADWLEREKRLRVNRA